MSHAINIQLQVPDDSAERKETEGLSDLADLLSLFQ